MLVIGCGQWPALLPPPSLPKFSTYRAALDLVVLTAGQHLPRFLSRIDDRPVETAGDFFWFVAIREETLPAGEPFYPGNSVTDSVKKPAIQANTGIYGTIPLRMEMPGTWAKVSVATALVDMPPPIR